MEEVVPSSLQGFVFELTLNPLRSKCKDESLGSHFIPSHSTFEKFQFPLKFTQSSTQQSNKQHKYLFNISFQNLEFWDVTLSKVSFK